MHTHRVLKIARICVVVSLAFLSLSATAGAVTTTLERQLLDAAFAGNLHEVSTLLDKGANVNAAYQEGFTALMDATIHGRVSVAKLLIARGSDVNAADAQGQTALMFAAKNTRLEVLKLLIDKGANVNAKDRVGATPLIWASTTPDGLETVKCLIERGADLKAVTESGKTALDMAVQYARLDVASYLSGKNVSQSNGLESYHGARQYPDTPREVVEAFIKMDMRDFSLTCEEMGMWSCDYPFQSSGWVCFPNEEDLKSNSKSHALNTQEPFGHSIDRFHIVTGHKITSVQENHIRASVKLLYRRLGFITTTPLHVRECRFPITAQDGQKMKTLGLLETAMRMANKKRGSTWNDEDCRILVITNDVKEVTYHLARPGSFWRMTDLCEPHISVNAAVKFLCCRLMSKDDERSPSEHQKMQIADHIRFLEKFLPNGEE